MPKDTKFNLAWLEKTDCEGFKLNKWLKQGGNNSTFQCVLCKTRNLDCSNQGYGAVQQHMKTKNHTENMKILKNNSSFVIESSQTSASSTNNAAPFAQLRLNTMRKPILLDFEEQVAKSKAIWALTVAQRGYSFKSCDEIGDIFRSMFPDSKTAQEFTMQSKKISYVLSHGLGPYFHQELVKCLKRSQKLTM